METKSRVPVPVPMSMPPRWISTKLRLYRLSSLATFRLFRYGIFLNFTSPNKKLRNMDLSELIKCYSMNQKSLFTAFVIALPVLFSVMYLYIPEFMHLEMHVQAIFTCTASIILIFMYYLLILFCCTMLDIGYKPNVFLVLLPVFLSSLYLLFFPDFYASGYEYARTVFLHIYLLIASVFIPVCSVFRLLKIVFSHIKNERMDEGNKE